MAARGCNHLARAAIELADGATLLWRDELICGRHAEESGDATVVTSVNYGGRPLLRQSLSVGPSALADGWAGPGVLGGAKASGSLLRVDPRLRAAGAAESGVRVLGPTAVRLPLAGGPASLTTATADDAHTLRACLDAR